jgi:hypothetical protein
LFVICHLTASKCHALGCTPSLPCPWSSTLHWPALSVVRARVRQRARATITARVRPRLEGVPRQLLVVASAVRHLRRRGKPDRPHRPAGEWWCTHGRAQSAFAVRIVPLAANDPRSGREQMTGGRGQKFCNFGLRPLGWTGSGCGFDRLPGVVILEL